LSFWKQEAGMEVPEIISGYEALAGFELARGIAALPVREQPRQAAV
jgi:hypothetical protein